jgi:SAM-dependent methyltransferase
VGVDDEYQRYYDQPDLWRCAERSGSQQERLKETLALVPPDVASALEVGCGDGFVVDALSARCYAVGLDIGLFGLQKASCDRVQGYAQRLPFGDGAFDIVLALEVIEHLPQVAYVRALREFERVARRYLLISVPNNEFLQAAFTRCPECGCTYHVRRHLRSFGLDTLQDAFPHFQVVQTALTVPVRRPIPWEVWIRQHIGGEWRSEPTAVCPQCGHQGTSYRRNAVGVLCGLVRRAFAWRRSPQWIIACYERSPGL